MASIESLFNVTKRYSLMLGNTYWVYITHVNNPHSFYVRPQEYKSYMSCVPIRGEPLKKSEIIVGSIVIFKSKLTNNCVRGKIISVDDKGDKLRCDLFALDIGFVENGVSRKKLWKPFHQINLPALAFHCQLANCIPRSEKWKQTTIEAMKGYVLGELAKITIRNILPEVFVVEVCISSPDDVATLLTITRHTSFGYMDDLDYQFIICCTISNKFYSERILQVKSDLHVCLLSGSLLDKFFAAEVDDYKTYLEESAKYTAYAEKERSLCIDQLELNAPVGVYFHRTNQFERGIVREIMTKKNKAKVELVDLGKMVVESTDLMRPIPGDFLNNPPIAIYCALHISQYSKMKLSEISNLAKIVYPGIEFYIKFEEVSEVYESPNLVTVFGIKT